MFGSLGAPEIILIFIVALLVFGPKRLPEIGRKIGGIARDLRRTTGDFRASVEREIGLDPVSGAEEAPKGRRGLLSAVTDPLRDAASGVMGPVRDLREAIILPPAPAVAPPPGSVPGPAPGRGAEPAPSEGPASSPREGLGDAGRSDPAPEDESQPPPGGPTAPRGDPKE